MKTNYFIQVDNSEMPLNDIADRVKAQLKESGHKQTEITSLDVYIKPKENEVYLVGVTKTGLRFEDKL